MGCGVHLGAGFPLKKRINRYSTDSSSVLPYGLFLTLCAAIAWVLIGDALEGPLVAFLPQASYWEYAAVLREWLQHPFTPGNPQVNDPVLSAHFMPWFWLLTMIGRLLNLSPTQLLSVSSVAGFVAIAAGMLLFLREYFRNAWAPFIGMLVVFGFWGVAGHWAGVLQLRNFVYVAAYPSSLVFGLSLISFWMTIRLLQSGRTLPLWAAALALITSFAFLTHPFTAVFGITGCAVLALTEPTNLSVKRFIALFVLIAGLALAELWPYFSIWKLLLGMYGPGIEGLTSAAAAGGQLAGIGGSELVDTFYDPAVIAATLGLSLLGLPAVIYLMQKDRRPFIVYGALLMLVPYVLNIIIDIPMAHHFLFFSAVYFQFAIVWAWLRLIGAWKSLPRPAFAVPAILFSVVAGATVLIANVWMVQLESQGRGVALASLNIDDTHLMLADGKSVPTVYGELLAPVADDAVVLAMPDIGLPVAAVKGRVVSPYADNPMLTDQDERLQATREFFLWPAGDLDRVATVQQYSVSHVLIDTSDSDLHAGVRPWLESYSRLVAEQGSLRMYQLAEALHQVKLPEPQASAMVEAAFVTSTLASKAVNDKPDRQAAVSGSRREPRSAAPQNDVPAFGAPISKPLFQAEPSGS